MSFLKKKLVLFSSINASSPRKLKEMLSRDGQKSIEGKLMDFHSLAKETHVERKALVSQFQKSRLFWLFWGGKLQVDNSSFSSETHDGPRMYVIYTYNVHDHVDCLKPKVRTNPKMLSPFGA